MKVRKLKESRLYHIIIFASAALVLILGSIYRSTLKEKATEAVSPGIETLLTEVKELKTALKKSELESIQRLVTSLTQQAMPRIVFISATGASAPPRPTAIYKDNGRRGEQRRIAGAPPAEPGISGILIDSEGHILTSANVAKFGSRFNILFNDSSSRIAEMVALDGDENLALLKLQPPGATVRLSDSIRVQKAKIGDWLVRLGRSPSGEKIVSLGMLSLVRRDPAGRETFFLDAETVPEQDGGPVINLESEIVGISILLPEDRSAKRLTVPIERALTVAQRLKAEAQTTPTSWIGLELQELNEDLKKYFQIENGALVVGLSQDGPAFKAGLRTGDVITRLDDNAIETAERLIQAINKTPPGTKLKITVNRGGAERVLPVETLPFSAETTTPQQQEDPQTVSDRSFGLELVRSSRQDGAEIKDVLPDSQAHLLGLQPGDVIVEINGNRIRGYQDFLRNQRSTAPGGLQLWQINRKEQRFFIAVKDANRTS